MEASTDQSENYVNLRMEMLATDNPYVQHVIDFYKEAVATHERGEDLAQYLHSVTFAKYEGYFGTHIRNLGEKEINIVLAGRQSEDSGIDYAQRLGFALHGSGGWGQDQFHFHLPLIGDVWFKDYEEFKQYVSPERQMARFQKEGLMGSLAAGELLEEALDEAKRVVGDDLDKKFDTEGKRRNQLDDINLVMTGFAMAIEEREAVMFFAGKIEDAHRRVDLYFEAARQDTEASNIVLEMLSGLEAELQSNPHELSRYLINQIDVADCLGCVDIVNNVVAVATLITDRRLFTEMDEQRTRVELAKTLLHQNFPLLAKTVTQSYAGAQLSELARVTFRDNAEKAFWTDREALELQTPQKRSWSERRRARQLGQSAVETEVSVETQVEELTAIIERDEKWEWAWRASNSPEPLPANFFDSRQLPQSQDLVGLQRSFNDHNAADRYFHDLVQSDREMDITKLAASIAMARSFMSVPEIQIEREAAIGVAMDALESDILKEGEHTVISGSAKRQELLGQIQTLGAQIKGLHGEKKSDFDRRLQELRQTVQ